MSDMQSDVDIVDGEEGQVAENYDILNGEELDRVVKFLQDEYNAVVQDMEPKVKKIIKWRKMVEAVSSDAPKTSPFKNASNVTMQLTQTIVQDMYALLKGVFDARDPLWTVESKLKDPEIVRRHQVVQKFMSMLARSPQDLNMEEVLKDMMLEVVVTGGCFPKVIWDTSMYKVAANDGSNTSDIMKHDGPAVIVAPIERVHYRRGVGDIEKLPWMEITTPMTEVQLKEYGARGIFDSTAVEEIVGQFRTSATDTEAQQQEAEWFNEVATTGLYDISEVWFYWDVDGSGVPVDLFFTIHMPTGKVLKQQYNSLGTRFITSAKYFHRSFALTGRGVGQMTESMNDEATSIHNLTNDNMKIANMRMFAVKGPLMNQSEEIFPGKLWKLESADDLRSIPMGDVYPSSSARESLSWNIAQKATGLSDNQMGFADGTMKSRDTARGQAMRLQKGDTIQRTVIEGLKTSIGKVGMLVWMQCVANKDRVIAREKEAMRLSDDEIKDLEVELSIELSKVPTRLAFNVQTTENEKTFEMQRQNMLMLAQLTAQFWQQTIPMAVQLFGPSGQAMMQQAPELYQYMLKSMTGVNKLMDDIYQFFGVNNTLDYLPDMEKQKRLGQMISKFSRVFAGQPQPAMMPQAQQVQEAQEAPRQVPQEQAQEQAQSVPRPVNIP